MMFKLGSQDSSNPIRGHTGHSSKLQELLVHILDMLLKNNQFLAHQKTSKSQLLVYDTLRLDMQGMTTSGDANYQVQMSTKTVAAVLIDHKVLELFKDKKYDISEHRLYLARMCVAAFNFSYKRAHIYKIILLEH